jgi:hypothetical protein
MKYCGRCKQDLPFKAFNKNKRTKDGWQTQCRKCIKEQRQKWAKENPEKRRKRKLLANYGITTEQYNEMLEAQSHGCKICGSKDPRNKSYRYLVVDHCHQSGIVRGLLCDYCNVALGRFEDDIDRLKAAVQYLRDAYAE